MVSSFLVRKELTIPKVLEKESLFPSFVLILHLMDFLSTFSASCIFANTFPSFLLLPYEIFPSDSQSLFPTGFFCIHVHGFHCLSLCFVSSLTRSATFVEVLCLPLIRSQKKLHFSLLPEQTFLSPKISILLFAKRTTVVLSYPLTWLTCTGLAQLSTPSEVCFILQ